ncbi:MAG: hypothetical protein WBI07_05220 [Mobilitalea sp.]
MIGLLYILLSFTLGWTICTFTFPNLRKITEKSYDMRKISCSPYLLLLPVWYVVGTLVITWSTYLVASIFGESKTPLLYANAIVMPVVLIISAVAMYYRRNKKENTIIPFKDMFTADKKIRIVELILLASLLLLAVILMWRTFFIRDNQLYIGVSVFSDFSPHIGMIRSFSYGNNFPTQYPHYAGEDIRYHFMFQFLTGNLEFLGLPLDAAFNIPSVISLVSAFLMLYLMTLKITGKIGAGILACLFFAFRSSKSLFTYLANLPEKTDILSTLINNTSFIGDTPNENWGLWNLNVYCNQRHLALGLTVMFFVIIVFLPQVYHMFENLKQLRFEQESRKKKKTDISLFSKLIERIKVIFFTKEGWAIVDMKQSVAIGILLGSLSFFHGSAVIGCLLVLFVMAVLSQRRLEYAVAAMIAITMSLLQTHFFIEGSAVSTKLLFGFIAEIKTFFGVASFLERLLGILPFVILAAFSLEKGVGRYLILAFSMPLVFALTVSMTIDVTVNHKYIMMSCILLGVFAASLITKMMEKKDLLLRLIGLILIAALTSTGIYDFATVIKKNTSETAIVLDLEDPLTDWINENSDSNDIFLTSNYTINQVVLGGAMLYEGWPYYPWSAGYNTDLRTLKVAEMYETPNTETWKVFVKENNIRFIIVDHDNRVSEDYVVNETNIAAAFECVYSEGEGEWTTNIYDTQKPLP